MKKPTKTPKRIFGVRCSSCKKRLFSFHVHDYKTCGCPNQTMVDGGREYLRYGCAGGWAMPKRIYWTEKLDGIYPVVKYKDSFPR